MSQKKEVNAPEKSFDPIRLHRQILGSPKLKASVDDNFKFDGNGREFSKKGKRNREKRRNCSLSAIYPFPQCFQKICTKDT